MNRYKTIAMIGAMLLGLAGLGMAQTEDYAGQQLANSPAAQSAQMTMCSHMQSNSIATNACPPKGAKEVSKKQTNPATCGQAASLPSCCVQHEGDPNAPQNHVEYRG